MADLLERHGVDTVRALYVGDELPFIERLEETTASSLPLLQAAWETAVASASRGAASREPIIEALSLLRLNRVDEAVAMLERRREEHPDNPVVEYALAHARRENGDTAGSAASYRRLLDFALPYHLAWMQERARQALQELEDQESAVKRSRSGCP